MLKEKTGMEITRYEELKKKQLIEIAKIGGSFAYSKKQFDFETGDELEPTIGSIDIKQLEEQKIMLQKQIAAIDNMINDCQLL